MEIWRLKVHVRRGILCSAPEQRAFLHFSSVVSRTDVSYGDGKGAIFLSFASSVQLALLRGVNNFVQKELFILAIFTNNNSTIGALTLIGIGSKPTDYHIVNIRSHYIFKCVLYCSRYQHTKFRTCMKSCTVFAIFCSTILSLNNNNFQNA